MRTAHRDSSAGLRGKHFLHQYAGRWHMRHGSTQWTPSAFDVAMPHMHGYRHRTAQRFEQRGGSPSPFRH